MSEYVERVIAETAKRNPDQPEFLQTVTEVLHSIAPVVDAAGDLTWPGLALVVDEAGDATLNVKED